MFCVLLLGTMAARGANAQVQVYAAKFTCGPVPASAGGGGDADVVVGVYMTSINIHNPTTFTQTFKKKVVIANQELESSTQPRGPIGWEIHVLDPDAAVRVACAVIYRILRQEPVSHIEGFVVLEPPERLNPVFPPLFPPLILNVVGKYSARPSNGEVSSLDVVVYTPTQVTQ
jgi:hypothetical protein